MGLTLSRRPLLILAIFVGLIGTPALAQRPPPETPTPAAIGGRADRTPAEQKLDSSLMFAARAFAPTRGQIPLALQPQVQGFIDQNVAADQTIFVVIKANVSPDLVAMLKVSGAYDISEFAQYDTITARVPITALLSIAQRSDVRTIGPKELYRLNRYRPAPEALAAMGGAVTNAGLLTWQGVGAHQADLVQSTGIDGTGVKVCVLSDGVNSLAARQASGDLPPTVTVLAGQAGSGDEGTAMLEIIHDMAPGAALGFATADPSQAQFATNIIGLQAAGCSIIVDDISYLAEGAFQDDTVSAAVNTVTAAGALYFSSAANSGNKTQASSGTFEGDFVASAAAVPAAILTAEGGPVVLHSFGALPYTTLTAATSVVSLKWSDPLAASANDYDLFVMDSTGTNILCVPGISVQSGTQAPVEFAFCNVGSFPVGARIYIVKFSGSTRALRLDTFGGVITQTDATTGSTFGHNAAASALTVASIGYNGGAFLSATPFTGGTTVHVDFYSSDGPRKMFYNPNGTAITPGNVLFGTGGGTTLAKVDLTASDCGSTTTPGFTPFCGTSAAAPTAASIAALIKSAKPAATKAQITAALLASALDIEAAGTDRDSGVGIVMSPAAVRAVLSPLTVGKSFSPSSIALGGTSTLTITLTNPNTIALQNVAFTDTYPAQITNSASPNPGGSGAGCGGTLSATPNGGSFAMTLGVVPAGATCNIFVTVTSSTGGTYVDNTGAVTTPIALNSSAASASLHVGPAAAPPVLASAVSRRVHGAAGTFDLPLSAVTTNPTTEPRSGPAQTIVFTFDKPINAATVNITVGTAAALAPTFNGNDVIVDLTGVTDLQYVTLSLTNVASTDGGSGGAGSVRVGFLRGDVNQSRVVTFSDMVLTNTELTKPVTALNFLKDVSVNGALTFSDMVLINSNLTRSLPAP